MRTLLRLINHYTWHTLPDDDATSAFNSIPHVALDTALTRIGAPTSFITWIRSMLDGHCRVVATAYGVSAVDDAAVLQAGEP